MTARMTWRHQPRVVMPSRGRMVLLHTFKMTAAVSQAGPNEAVCIVKLGEDVRSARKALLVCLRPQELQLQT